MLDDPSDCEEKISQESPSKQVIPAPDLTKRSVPPRLALDPLNPSSPSLSSPIAENPSARVNLQQPRDSFSHVENGLFESQLAPFHLRVLAALIDVGVGLGIILGLSWLLPDFLVRLAQFTGMAYFVVRDSLPLLQGQSFGKKAMNLRVCTWDEQSLERNWRVALLRNGLLLIPLVVLLELYVLLNRENGSRRGRRLGDEWAKTRVIIEEIPMPPVKS